jgi:hypothetical protein
MQAGVAHLSRCWIPPILVNAPPAFGTLKQRLERSSPVERATACIPVTKIQEPIVSGPDCPAASLTWSIWCCRAAGALSCLDGSGVPGARRLLA